MVAGKRGAGWTEIHRFRRETPLIFDRGGHSSPLYISPGVSWETENGDRKTDGCLSTGDKQTQSVWRDTGRNSGLCVTLTYVFKSRDVFSVEVSTYLLVFICFASVAYVLRENRHVVVDAMLTLLSPKTRLKLELVASFLTLGFCSILTWQAADVTLLNYQRGFRSASLVTLPLWIPYLVITLGAFGVVLQSIVQIREYKGRLKILSENTEGEDAHKGGLIDNDRP
jgi:TRAP-type C4-dicarboxylate transport system permease small subunit